MSQSSTINRQLLLANRPEAKLSPEHFQLVETPIPSPRQGEFLTRTLYLSLDAANRAWIQGRTYRENMELDKVMRGGTLSEVVESKAAGFEPGDLVFADTGWQDYTILTPDVAKKVSRIDPLSHLISVYSLTGLTAYFGVVEVCKPKPGQTFVISAAAGATAQIAGQIAKLMGARVVGIVGSDEKAEMIKRDFGYDDAVNYKSGPIKQTLKAACPDGIDLYFDNVGGEILEAVILRMNIHGRIACCGAISQYDGQPPAHGPRGVPGFLITKRITMQGFLVYDWDQAAHEKALKQLQDWVQSGKIKVHEDIMEGLENAPQGLIGLLAGNNVGKRMIKVA